MIYEPRNRMKNFNEVINDVFLSKNGIVLTDKEKMFLLIVYNDASIPCPVMYNKNLMYYYESNLTWTFSLSASSISKYSRIVNPPIPAMMFVGTL